MGPKWKLIYKHYFFLLLQHRKHSSFLRWTAMNVHNNRKTLTTLSFPSGYLGKPSSAIESLLSYHFRHFFFKYSFILFFFLIRQRTLYSFLECNYIFDVFTASQFNLKADFHIVSGSLHLKDLHSNLHLQSYVKDS